MTFKSAVLGGFDKEDVITYIDKVAQEHSETVQNLEKELDAMRQEKASFVEEVADLRGQVADLTESRDQLQKSFNAKNKAFAELEPLQGVQAENSRLADEVAALRPQADAYKEMKLHIGEIECSARERAETLKNSTIAKLNHMISDCRSQYAELMTTLDVTSTHVSNELRKVEVNLTQLPRAMDKVGSDLNELEDTLEKIKEEDFA